MYSIKNASKSEIPFNIRLNNRRKRAENLNVILQSFTKYLRPALVFMRNSALREKFNLFLKSFLLVLTMFSFWQEDWARGYVLWSFITFKSLGNLWGNSYIPSNNRASFPLWWKENLVKHFKKSQNFMKMIVASKDFNKHDRDLKNYWKFIIIEPLRNISPATTETLKERLNKPGTWRFSATPSEHGPKLKPCSAEFPFTTTFFISPYSF